MDTADRFPDTLEFQKDLAGGTWEKMQGTWETLLDVAGRFPDHATIQYRLATGALRAMIFDRTRQRRLERGKTRKGSGGQSDRSRRHLDAGR